MLNKAMEKARALLEQAADSERAKYEAQLADLVALHGRSSSLTQSGQSVSGHVGALIDGQGTGSDLHGESHAGGVAAVLAVGFGGQLKDVKTFQCHGIFPPSLLTSGCR